MSNNNPLPCGCSIMTGMDYDEIYQYIEFCPLHAAAPELLAALTAAPVHHSHNCYVSRDDKTGELTLGECYPLCWERKRQAAIAAASPDSCQAEKEG